MITVFDTSAIVAANTLTHELFGWAYPQVAQAERPALCAHSLAECYAIITASPQIRLPPAQAVRLLSTIEQTWTVLPLTPAHYLRAAERCRDLALQGGAIYDTLIAEAALGADASALVTLNPRHFRRLGADVERLVVAP